MTLVEMSMIARRPDEASAVTRPIAVEAPVAIEVNGLGYAVMMMTPADLDAFAIGFMLTERLVDTITDIVDIEPFEAERGSIVRVTVAEHCAARIQDRVRHRSSDTGCGLCGLAGLDQVVRPVARPAPLPHANVAAIFTSLSRLREHQPLNRATGAVHAAAFCNSDGDIVAAVEDVGRHNALDKLIGRMAREEVDVASGFVLITSRISFEMVDKALVSGASLLVGISAPTSMAIDHARANRLTLIGLARDDAVLIVNDPAGIFAT